MCVACIRKWLWIASCVLCILYITVCPGSGANDHIMLLENCGWESYYMIYSLKETIKTPGIDVSPNLVCRAVIGPAGSSLSLKVVKFNLNGSGECSPTSERLSLEYRWDQGYKNITWCGQTFAEELNLPLADVTLVYNSGAYGEGSGFEVLFSLVDSKGWNLPRLSASAEPKLLYSPNYPGNYPGSISTSVILTTDAGQYLHIKSREISIEPSSRCDFDYLSVNKVLYCGDEHIDVIVPSDSTELKFTSDHGQEESGFVLEYSSLAHQSFSCANDETLRLTASEYTSLIVINQTLFKSNKSCSLYIDSGSDDKVLAVNTPLLQIYTISFDKNQVLNRSFPAAATYFQSPGRDLSISLDIGLFQTNDSWIMWNLTVQAIDRGFIPTRLPSESSLIWINPDMIRGSREHHFDISRRVGFKVFGADLCCSLPVSEKVLLFNGPDKSFFELTRDCRGLPRSDMAIFSEGGAHAVTVVMRNTSYTEFWLYVGPADPSQAMLKTEFKDNSSFNSYSLIKSLNVKNLFCRWEIQPSMLPVTIQARSNFSALSNNSFVVKQVLSLDDPRSKAEAQYNQDTPVGTLMYSFYPVVITVSIVDQDSQYQSPDFSFSYQRDVYLINQSSYNFSSLKASNQKQIVQTPYYPHFYPSNIYYSWTIKNTPTEEASSIVLSFPDLSNVLCSDTSMLNISTSVVGDIFGQPSRICGKKSLTQYYEESAVRVEFTTKAIIKPGFQFFFYHEASSVQQYNCGSNITLQERVSTYLVYVQKPSVQYQDCYFYLYPTSHDSSITLSIDLDFQYGNNLIVYAMKPSVISSTKYRWQEVLSLNQQSRQTGNFTFTQSTLAVKAHFDYMPTNFKIRALLSRDSCFDAILEATTVDNYLASPRYPEPYPLSTVCRWNIISKQGNIILETMDFILEGLSYSCTNDYLLVYAGPIQDQILLGPYCAGEQLLITSTNEITVVFKPDQSYETLGFRLKYYARPTSILTTTKSSYPDDTSAPPSMILGSVIGCIIFAVLLFAAVILIIKKRRMANRLPRREPCVYMNRRESTIFIVNPVIISNMSPPPYPGLEPDSLLSNVPSIFASPPPYSEHSQSEEDDPTYHNIDLPPPYSLNDQVSPANSQELEGNNQPESRGDNSEGQGSQSPDVIYDVAGPLPYEAEYAEITLHHPVSTELANADPPPAYNDVRADSRNVQTGRQISRSVPGRGNSLGPL